MRPILLILLALNFSTPSQAAESPDSRLLNQCSMLLNEMYADSLARQLFVGQLRRELTSLGVTELNMSKWFPEALYKEMEILIPKNSWYISGKGRKLLGSLRSNGDTEEMPKVPKEFSDNFEAFGHYLESLINEAMAPHETVVFAELQIRHFGEDFSAHQHFQATDNKLAWHTDGGYFRAAVAVFGGGTFYTLDPQIRLRESGSYTQAKNGSALIFSGTDRSEAIPGIEATLHAPIMDHNHRFFIILSFYLRPLTEFDIR